MAKDDMSCSIFGVCHRCRALKVLILGILILLNAYLAVVNWAVFVGGIIAIAGIVKLIWTHCSHCK